MLQRIDQENLHDRRRSPPPEHDSTPPIVSEIHLSSSSDDEEQPKSATDTRKAFIKNTAVQLAFGLWYISMTTIQSFYNKKVFSAGFKFPVSLCFTQMVGVMVFLFAWRAIIEWFKGPQPDPIFSLQHFREKARAMGIIGACLAFNVMLANWSLFSTDMNTFIVVRSTSIVWIALFGWILLGMRVVFLKLLACFLVLIGSTAVGWSFASSNSGSGNIGSKTVGVLLCMGSTVVNGLMLIQMKRVLTILKTQKTIQIVGVSDEKPLPSFQKMDFLFYQSLAAAALLLFGVVFSEGTALVRVFRGEGNVASVDELATVLCVSSFVTIFYQLSLIGLVANTTPLGKEVISQTKVIPQTILSIILFDEAVSVVSVIGLVVAVAGLFLYSTLSYREDNPPVPPPKRRGEVEV